MQIETLPTRSQDVQPLQNVLSISTAGKNRYLFHFNSLHSLTQWTAGIRLAMFEHTTLQEAYTGSLIAGKGKSLNNIKVIMDRTKLKTEDWTRVRFGAGTPWRRCWCVISPPDEKEIQKMQKLSKKKSAYDRPVALKGDIKFYDTKKTKKTQPIATINDAYSAYAIYPQSKPLIDQSTLVKVEGNITIHSTPETTTEGFVFVMPEVHPAVTGFEMMLRWLFPLYDVFSLYGRPTRLIADTLDVRSLMFALPQEKRYDYLEILDVATLIHESGSQMWKEQEWRARLKELTAVRIKKLQSSGSRQRSRASSYRGHRNSLPSRAGTVRYEDGASIRSTPSLHNEAAPPLPIHREGSAPVGDGAFHTPGRSQSRHQRSASEAVPRQQRSQRSVADSQPNYTPSRLSYEAAPSNLPSQSAPPLPPAHGVAVGVATRNPHVQRYGATQDGTPDRSSSESERRLRGLVGNEAQEIRQDLGPAPPPAPVVAPPAFAHEAGAKPQKRPHASPELRRANSRMSITTLSQLADAGQPNAGANVAAASAATAWGANDQERHSEAQGQIWSDGSEARNLGHSGDQGQRGVIDDAGRSGTNADQSSSLEGMALVNANRSDSDSRRSPYIPATSEHQQLQQYLNNHQGQPTQTPISNTYPQDVSILPQYSAHSRAISPSWPAANDQENLPTNPQRTRSSEFLEDFGKVAALAESVPGESQRPENHRSSTAYSITRKPLPANAQAPASDPPSPVLRSSLDSLRDQFFDEEALDRIIARDPDRSGTMDSRHGPQMNEQDSIYDNDSNVSPDYASTRKSTETKRSKQSMDKPRAGVLRTVGTVEPERHEVVVGDTRYGSGVAVTEIQPAIPSVDFGPTQFFTPRSSSRPNTGAALAQPVHERSKSSDRLTPSPRNQSPANMHNIGDIYPSERLIESYERSPSCNRTTPDGRQTPSGGHEVDQRRNVAWQPGATIGGGSPGGRPPITPEQFVQQRAAANRITPVFAHGRKASGQGTPPAVSRNSSGEWPFQQHSRQVSLSKEIPSRPQSRGAPIVMNPSGDYSAHLSAREQEHVARVTGSPLINMASNTKRKPAQGGGLVGAIEAREKEKRDIKEGLSSHMVQHAIAQRQQQHSQSYQSNQQPFPSPSPQMQMPSQYLQTPYITTAQQQGYANGQQAFPSPGVQMWMPGQYPQTPYFGTPQQQYGWSTPQQQQYGHFQKFPLQQRQQWASPAAQQYWTATQTPTLQQSVVPNFQSNSQPQQAGYNQPGQLNQGSQQQYGPYFGNGQGGHGGR